MYNQSSSDQQLRTLESTLNKERSDLTKKEAELKKSDEEIKTLKDLVKSKTDELRQKETEIQKIKTELQIAKNRIPVLETDHRRRAREVTDRRLQQNNMNSNIATLKLKNQGAMNEAKRQQPSPRH